MDLNFWVMPNAGFATRSVLQPLIQEFERTHPHVHVHLVTHPWSLAWSRFMDVIKGRATPHTPDVIQVGTTWVTTLNYLGALDAIPARLFENGFLDGGWFGDPGDQKNKVAEQTCLPWFTDIRVIYYRKDVFDFLKFDTKLLESWSGFEQACLEIKNLLAARSGRFGKMLAPLGIPGQNPGVLMHDLAPWIWGAGGDFCSVDTLEPSLSDAALIEGCEYYFDLINKEYMPIPAETLPSGNFFTGHHAMQISGSWPVDTFLSAGYLYSDPDVVKNFAVLPMPAGPKGRYTFLGGSNLAVASGSVHKEAAWDLVRFLSESNHMLQHARSIGALPARLDTLDVLFEKHPLAKKAFWDSFSFARRLPRLVELGSVEQIMSKMGLRLLSHIREGEYNAKRLRSEIFSANNEIRSLLSVHRYGGLAA